MRYKEISLSYDRRFSGGELRAIDDFNASFNSDALQLSRSGKQLTVHLREVDIHKLRQTVRTLDSDNDNGLFNDVLHAVENIKSYALSGGKRCYIDYNKERKVEQRQQKSRKRTPYFYAQQHEYGSEENTAPASHVNTIITGDSEQVLRQLPDNCIDVVFTSPPYNFGLAYEGDEGDDAQHWQNYFDKLYAVLRQCIRVVKYGGRIIVNIQPLYSDYIPSHHMLSSFFMAEKMIWKGEILWEKNNYNCKYTAWGSWKSPSNPYLKYTWEFIEVFCKGDLKKAGERENIDIAADDFKKWVTAKWSIAPERNMKDYGHPAMFPEELARRVLQLFSYKNDLVLDPFNGVGTTTLVAKRLGRRYLGIDVAKEYCQTAKRRIQDEVDSLGFFPDL